MKQKTTFLDLVRESVISQALLTVIIAVGAIVVYIETKTLPDWLQIAFALVLGYFFGSGDKHKANTIERVVRAAVEASPPEAKGRIARTTRGERATDSIKAFVKEAERGDESHEGLT